MSRSKSELKSRLHKMKPLVSIGKGGVESALQEIKRQLKEKKLVKVKVLRAARADREVEEIAKEVAHATKAELIEIVGNTFGLFRKK